MSDEIKAKIAAFAKLVQSSTTALVQQAKVEVDKAADAAATKLKAARAESPAEFTKLTQKMQDVLKNEKD